MKNARENQRGFRFVEPPYDDLSLSSYEIAQNRYLNRISLCEDVVSVYRMGGFTAPGISDLDLIVVLEPQISCDPTMLSVKSVNSISETRGVFRHGPMLMQAPVFESLPFVFAASELTHLYGQKLPQLNVPPSLEHVRDVVLAIEFLPRLLHRFERMLVLRRIAVREALASLYSAAHFQGFSDNVRACLPTHFPELVQQVTELRSNWKSQYTELPNLLMQMKAALYDFSWKLSECFLDSWLQCWLPDQVVLRQGPWQWACFSAKMQSPTRIWGRAWGISSFMYADTFVPFPLSMLAHYWYIASQLPYYASEISSRIYPRPLRNVAQVQSSNLDYRQYIQEFATIVSMQFDFMRTNRLFEGYIADLGISDWNNTFLSRPGHRPKIDWVVNLVYRFIAKPPVNVHITDGTL